MNQFCTDPHCKLCAVMPKPTELEREVLLAARRKQIRTGHMPPAPKRDGCYHVDIKEK